MKTVFKIMLLCVYVITNSCSSPIKKNINSYHIEKLLNVSEYFTFPEEYNTSYIPLKFDLDHPIGVILKIILTDNHIFVATYDYLLQYDYSGKFEKKIGSHGKGPGEYLMLLDVSIDETSKKIYIADSNRQIIEYDLITGKYIKSYRNDSILWRFELVKESFLINPLFFLGSEQNKLILMSFNQDTLKHYHNDLQFVPRNTFIEPDRKTFQKYNNEIIFRQMFNDTIYTFHPTDGNLSIRYYFDFGNIKLPMNVLGDMEQFERTSNEKAYLNDITETEDYIFATVMYKRKEKRYIIHKTSGKNYSTAEDKKITLKKSGIDVWPLWYEKNTLIDFFQPAYLLENINNITDENLKKITHGLTEESNPVVILIKRES